MSMAQRYKSHHRGGATIDFGTLKYSDQDLGEFMTHGNYRLFGKSSKGARKTKFISSDIDKQIIRKCHQKILDKELKN